MFSLVELTEVKQQRRDKHFINLLNKVRVANVDSKVERTLKSRIICSSDFHYPNYALHVFAQDVSEFNHNKVMVDQINGMLITIDVIDSISIGCGFPDIQIIAAINCIISQTVGLSKTLSLKLASVKRTDTHIKTQFRLTLARACTIHKVHQLSLPKSVISLELKKQKSKVEFIMVANIEGLYFPAEFKKDAIKADTEAFNKHNRLQEEALFSPVSLLMSLPESLLFILLNVRSLVRHAIDIAYDKKLIENDNLFLAETQVSQTDNLILIGVGFLGFF